MTQKYRLMKHPLGFYEADPKPTNIELSEYYAKKYYQQSRGQYAHTYSEDELRYFKVQGELTLKTIERFSAVKKKKLLDLGCGEGFFADFFCKKGWTACLIDFSDDGLKRHNPSLLESFTQGDLLTYIESEEKNIKEYNLINLDNVLEHVIDPIGLLTNLKSCMNSDAILRIEIPNDFSAFQNLLTDLNYTKETWVSPPEHLNYFNKRGLKSLLESQGFHLLSLQADFPIEQFLINEHSNYWKDRRLGKGAHLTRILITNYMADQSLDRMIDYREAAADLEFGRLLTAYVRIAN